MKMLNDAELRTMLIYIQYTQYVDGVYKEEKHIWFNNHLKCFFFLVRFVLFCFLQWMHS